jgi:hypothetical protein
VQDQPERAALGNGCAATVPLENRPRSSVGSDVCLTRRRKATPASRARRAEPHVASESQPCSTPLVAVLAGQTDRGDAKDGTGEIERIARQTLRPVGHQTEAHTHPRDQRNRGRWQPAATPSAGGRKGRRQGADRGSPESALWPRRRPAVAGAQLLTADGEESQQQSKTSTAGYAPKSAGGRITGSVGKPAVGDRLVLRREAVAYLDRMRELGSGSGSSQSSATAGS